MSSTSESVIGANIGVGNNPLGVYVDSYYAWFANSTSNSVSQIPANYISTEYYYYSNYNPVTTITVGTTPVALVSDGTYCWVANSGSNTVSQIEISSSTVINTITVGSNPQGIATNSNYVFVSNYNDNTVSTIDKNNNPPNVVQTITYNFNKPIGIAANEDYLFVANSGSNSVTQYYLQSSANSATAQALSITVGTGPLALSLYSNYLWVSCPNIQDIIYQINLNNANSVSQISITQTTVSSVQYANAISSDGTYVWITNTSTSPSNGVVLQLEISSSSIINTFPYSNFFNDSYGISSNGRYCWAASYQYSTATQIEILTNYQYLGSLGNPTQINETLFFPYSMAVNPQGTNIFITCNDVSTGRSYLLFVDTQTQQLIQNPIGIYIYTVIISADKNYCWVPTTSNNLVLVYSIVSGLLVEIGSITLPDSPIAAYSDGTYVWVANLSGTVSVIDATSIVLTPYSTTTNLNSALITTFSLQNGSRPSSIVSDGTNVWVVDTAGGNVAVFPVTIVLSSNPSENISYINIPNSNTLQGIASDSNYIWVTDIGSISTNFNSYVFQIDKSSYTVINQIGVQARPFFCVSNGTTVFISCSIGTADGNDGSGVVSTIDISNDVVSQSISTYPENTAPKDLSDGCYGIIYFTNPYSTLNPQVWVVENGESSGVYLTTYNVLTS